MPKPKKLKAIGDKNSGYSNTLKSNNITYLSNKDKLYSCLSNLTDISSSIFELGIYLHKDFIRLKKYLSKMCK